MSDDESRLQLAQTLGIKTELGRAALRIAIQNIQLFDGKQQDYGPNNIALWGDLGVAVRATDKVMRLRNILISGQEPNNESIEDSFADLANYGIIGQLIRRGIWPVIK